MKTKNLKLFEKYHNGQMTPDEKADFDKSLASDPELNASFREYLSVYEALSDLDTLDLRKKLKEIKDENSWNKSSPDFFGHGYNWIWMAALLTIIVSFTFIVSRLISNKEMNSGIITVNVPQETTPHYSQLDRELMRFEQRHSDFSLQLPEEPIIYKELEPLKFQWTISAADKLILELIDWNGNVVFSTGKPVPSPYTIKRKLPAGAMIYRFRNETNAFFLGFLYIK